MRIPGTIGPFLVGLCGMACATGLAGAGTAGLKHERSIYTDEGRGRLEAPEGVACGDDGSLVIADSGHGRLLTYTWLEGALRGGKPIALPQLPAPTRIQLDGAGNLLVLDRKLRRIGRIDAGGAFAGYLGVVSATAIVPVAFKLGPSGNVYLLDAPGRRLLVIEPSGRIARAVALPESGSFTDLALGAGGSVYAVDAVAATVWVVDAEGGAFRRLTPSLKARIRFPTDMASDGRGRLYIVDHHGDAIVALGEDGSFQGRALGSGRADGLLSHAAQLCVTRDFVFVADRDNNRVQVFEILRDDRREPPSGPATP
jgi:sugar lactone lactonase YvrE